VTANGSKTYYVYRKLKGAPFEYRIGAVDTMTLDDARDAVDALNRRISYPVLTW